MAPLGDLRVNEEGGEVRRPSMFAQGEALLRGSQVDLTSPASLSHAPWAVSSTRPTPTPCGVPTATAELLVLMESGPEVWAAQDLKGGVCTCVRCCTWG